MSNRQLLPVTIGHDAEAFLGLRDPNIGDYRIKSSIGLVGGTKEEPMPVPGSKYGLTLQEDNVTVELGMSPVAVTATFATDWRRALYGAVDEADKFIRKKLKSNNYNLRFQAAAEFSNADLEVPKAAEFGCDPDFLAHQYGERRFALKAADIQKEVGLRRFAGGHIHIGYDKKAVSIKDWALIQLIEAYCYYPFMSMDRQSHRQNYYGLAGLYRPKSYGVEYRTPSAFWIHEAENLVPMIGKFAQAILSDIPLAKKLYADTNFALVQQEINAPRGTIRRASDYANQLYTTAETIVRDLYPEEERVAGRLDIAQAGQVQDADAEDEEEEENF